MNGRSIIRRIVRAYSGSARFYAAIRCRIIRAGILESIERHLPDAGTIADLGCGFGLFALYLAVRKPGAEILGMDIDRRRIEVARAVAERLGLRNVRFVVQDLADGPADQPVVAACAVDLLHHVSSGTAGHLLAAAHRALVPGGKLVVKDVDTQPWWQLPTCYLTDFVTAPGRRVWYRPSADLARRLAAAGFADIRVERLRDALPYPHVLLVSSKPK